MTNVYLGLGANLNQPQQQIRSAIEALTQHPEINLVLCSSLYGSKPMGPQDQPDYVNAVAQIETTLNPIALLDVTQEIEQTLGRVRKNERWGPRTLDIDILLFGDQTLNIARLEVPHYGMKEREFVLYPLLEIAPKLSMPDGTSIAELTTSVALNELTVLCPF